MGREKGRAAFVLEISRAEYGTDRSRIFLSPGILELVPIRRDSAMRSSMVVSPGRSCEGAVVLTGSGVTMGEADVQAQGHSSVPGVKGALAAIRQCGTPLFCHYGMDWMRRLVARTSSCRAGVEPCGSSTSGTYRPTLEHNLVLLHRSKTLKQTSSGQPFMFGKQDSLTSENPRTTGQDMLKASRTTTSTINPNPRHPASTAAPTGLHDHRSTRQLLEP